MTYFLRWPISQLPSQVGINSDDGTRIARDVEGFVSFGPYCRLESGTYFGGFHIRALEQSDTPELLQITVCCQEGDLHLGTRNVSGGELYLGVAGLVGVDFTVKNESSDIEVRLEARPAAAVEVRSLVIFRNDPI